MISRRCPPGSSGGGISPLGAVAAFGYLYTLSGPAIDITILANADVPFEQNGPLRGVSHAPGATTFTVEQSGTYRISYTLLRTEDADQAFGIAVNGTVRGETVYSSTEGQLHGEADLALNAGDVLTLRNVGLAPVLLPVTVVNGFPAVVASLLIEKIG